jgi:nickel-dependent lactate racemase
MSSMSWNDRFALIDYYKPTDEQVIKTMSVSAAELATARELRRMKVFIPNHSFDVERFGNPFDGSRNAVVNNNITKDIPRKNVSCIVREERKRGRKGNKIATAFANIPHVPTSIEDFSKRHGVSIPVLRQSRRFGPEMAEKIHVRKDKNTGVVMIWRT